MKIDSLTFPRFIAAFALVIHHFAGNVNVVKDTALANFVEVSSTLVSFFYVLSGFILVIAYSNGGKQHHIPRKKFYLNRFARIYPVYLLALIMYLLLPVQARIPDEPATAGQIITSSLLIHAWIPRFAMCLNFPGWSLSVELFFYLLFPFIYELITRATSRNIVLLVCTFWAVNLLWYVYMMHHVFNFYFREYHPLNHLSTFVFGVGWGVLFVRHYQQWQKYSRQFSIAFIILLTFSCVLVYVSAPVIQYHHNGLFAPLFISGIIALSLNNSGVSWFFSQKGFILLGEISYSIYILQVPVLFWLKYINGKSIQLSKQTLSPAYVFVLIAIACLSYLTYEKSARSFIKRMA
jgi:peptidoglycan/LPS O-acetylase OafA/YrhL